jgi:hypothetical protein
VVCESNLLFQDGTGAPVAFLTHQKAAAGLAQRRLSQYEAADKNIPMRPRPKIDEDAPVCLIDGN